MVLSRTMHASNRKRTHDAFLKKRKYILHGSVWLPDLNTCTHRSVTLLFFNGRCLLLTGRFKENMQATLSGPRIVEAAVDRACTSCQRKRMQRTSDPGILVPHRNLKEVLTTLNT
jgi:hypothetical protein